MEQILTAITISVFMMMGSALYVLIWDVLEGTKKKNKNDLDEKVYQRLIDYLDTDDQTKISNFIEQTIIDHLNASEYRE